MSNTFPPINVVGSSSVNSHIALQPAFLPTVTPHGVEDSFGPGVVPSIDRGNPTPVLPEPGMIGLFCPTSITDAASRVAGYCRASFEAWLDLGIPLFIDAYTSQLYLPNAPRQSAADAAWVARNTRVSRD